MLTDVTIHGHREDYEYQPGGRAVKGVRTTFSVGDDGPFSVFLADNVFSPENSVAAVETKADIIRDTRALHQQRAR